MRKTLWSSAALAVLLSGLSAPWWATAEAATSEVTMGSAAEPNAFKFFPAEISVPVGTTVRWTNMSDIPHDATARDGAFKSDQLMKNDTFEYTFTTAGDFPYVCTVSGHEAAGMVALVKVTGGGSTPTTAAPPVTKPPGGGTTPTTAAAPGSSTTGTTSKAAAGGPTTTTTAGLGVTSTTQAAATTPTSASESAGPTTTTTAPTAGPEGSEAAATDHASEGGSEKKHEKSSPLGIAFAGLSTVLLMGISGKLLASKS